MLSWVSVWYSLDRDQATIIRTHTKPAAMESKSSVALWKEPTKEQCARDDDSASAAARRARASMMLMAASSGDSRQLRQWRGDILAAGAAPSPPPHEVAIDVVAAADGGEPALEAIVVTDETGSSALHVVAAAGDDERYLDSAREICRRDRRLLLGTPNRDGDTPLHCAARAGNARMVAHLVELAGDEDEATALVCAQNRRGETALHEAVRFCGLENDMIGALMDADRGLDRVVANDGTSPLYIACSLGRRGIAVELHQKADRQGLSYSGPDGQNALHAAVLHHKVIVKLLLEWNKGLVNQRDINGSTPMHFAASAADPSFQFTSFVFTTSKLESHFLGSTFLLPQRCLAGFYECRELPFPQLLKAEPSLAFQPDVHGSYPVHVAASAESMVAIIVLLTRYPGCAALRDAKGRTFLHVAVEKKRFHVVKFVCHRAKSFKPMLNVQDKDGNTALHLAVQQGEVDIFRCLIRNRVVKINLQNNQGNTPMDLSLGKVRSGFYFGLTAPRRILGMLTLANAQTSSANRRRDQMEEYNPSLNEEEESSKIKDFAQIVGIGSVLVATATFAAAITIPGGVTSKGTPLLTGRYAFDGFMVSNTLAFICSTLATFSLVYCGVAAVDIYRRFTLVSFSLALLLCAARSFCAAFAFSLFLLLAPVERGTAIAASVMTSLALLDGIWFLITSFHDATALFNKRTKRAPLKLVTGMVANIIYLFWPYLVIFGYLSIDDARNLGDF